MASEGHEVVVYIYDISKGMAKAMSQALLGKYLEENWININDFLSIYLSSTTS